MKQLVQGIKTLLTWLGWPVLFGLKLGWKIVRSYFFLGLFFLGISGALGVVYFKVLVKLPSVNEIYNPPRLSSKILDRNGKLLYKFYQDEDRTWVPISKIPPSLVNATLAIEDKDFLKHSGISLRGVAQAAYFNLLKKGQDGGLRGGSTITQQLVKSVFFSSEKTWERKLKEAILAIMVEKKLSKMEILERYFNQVAYGGETYGAQEAAKKYFDKNIWEVTAAEAAYLAGLPAAPSSYSPTGNNPQFGFLRQKHVINEMVVAGFISEDEGEKMKEEKVATNIYRQKIEAPHFVFFVRDYLEQKMGFDDFARRGMSVTTSLDLDKQKMAEKIVKEEVEGAKRLRISNGAAMIVEPGSGEVLAMVGSKDYFATDIDGAYNITTATRQPGSSIKPINYLLALERGWSLGSVVVDERVSYRIPGQSQPYSPVNYNGKYMGPVTLRTALASSLNIPSVKLLDANGVNNMIDLAEKMGISTWKQRDRYGLSLALGSGEIKMVEMTNAYSVLANGGKKTEINPVLEVDNYLGEKIFQSKPEAKEVVDPRLAFMINSALSDDNARAPVFGTGSKLKIANETVAVKTGTTNSLRDNWCVGWTSDYLVESWVGNNDNSPMSWVASGVSGATPIWNRIMRELLKIKKSGEWIKPPEGVYKANACGREEYYIEGREQQIKCLRVQPSPTPQI